MPDGQKKLEKLGVKSITTAAVTTLKSEFDCYAAFPPYSFAVITTSPNIIMLPRP